MIGVNFGTGIYHQQSLTFYSDNQCKNTMPGTEQELGYDGGDDVTCSSQFRGVASVQYTSN